MFDWVPFHFSEQKKKTLVVLGGTKGGAAPSPSVPYPAPQAFSLVSAVFGGTVCLLRMCSIREVLYTWSPQGTSVKIGTIQRRLAWSLRKNDKQ